VIRGRRTARFPAESRRRDLAGLPWFSGFENPKAAKAFTTRSLPGRNSSLHPWHHTLKRRATTSCMANVTLIPYIGLLTVETRGQGLAAARPRLTLPGLA